MALACGFKSAFLCEHYGGDGLAVSAIDTRISQKHSATLIRGNIVTCIYNNPKTFATTAIAGYSSVYARTVRAVSGGVVRSTATPEGKVALVVGGGSGHFPRFPVL